MYSSILFVRLQSRFFRHKVKLMTVRGFPERTACVAVSRLPSPRRPRRECAVSPQASADPAGAQGRRRPCGGVLRGWHGTPGMCTPPLLTKPSPQMSLTGPEGRDGDREEGTVKWEGLGRGGGRAGTHEPRLPSRQLRDLSAVPGPIRASVSLLLGRAGNTELRRGGPACVPEVSSRAEGRVPQHPQTFSRAPPPPHLQLQVCEVLEAAATPLLSAPALPWESPYCPLFFQMSFSLEG